MSKKESFPDERLFPLSLLRSATGGNGGGINVRSSSTLTVVGSQFDGNSAVNGGSICVESTATDAAGNTLVVAESNFRNSTAQDRRACAPVTRRHFQTVPPCCRYIQTVAAVGDNIR